MSLETGTYIADLQPVNPPDTDPEAQGAAHLRLIKQVLQNQFVGATRQWQIPSMISATTNLVMTKAQGESVVFVTTAGGPFTISLPSGLAAIDIGWSCTFYKYSNDLNPVFIAPPSGATLYSGTLIVARARRCIPGVIFKATYNGSGTFLLSRSTALPIGAMIDYYSGGLPPGYEWPNGQILASASVNYPEYYATYGGGNTPDMRGFTAITLDNLGGAAAGRLPSGYISGSTFGAVGGQDGVALVTSQMPAHNHTINISESPHSHYVSYLASAFSQYAAPASYYINYATYTGGYTSGATTGITATSVSAGNGLMHSNLQPSVMLSKILVVE